MADFGSMNDAQREAHYQMVCKSLDIDPALRLLDYIWMNNEQGPRSMVLYARRGAAEVLRQKRNISVTETIQVDANGYIMFMVKGEDKTGRVESAVGVSAIKELKGERLAYAIMTAHTRATRRLTLQFVGQGILDESEVNAPTADLSTSPASLAALAGSPVVLPPPQVPTTSAPGKDITPDPLAKLPEGVFSENPPFDAGGPPNVKSTIVDTIPDTVNDTTPKPKRTRKKRNTVDIASPGQEVEQQPVKAATAAVTTQAFAEQQQALRDEATRQLQAKPIDAVAEHIKGSFSMGDLAAAVAPAEPIAEQLRDALYAAVKSAPEPKTEPKAKDVPTIAPEKLADYRARLAKFSQDILPKAGMMPSDGIGGVTMKLRKFATVHTGADTNKLTEEQWTDLLNFLDVQSKDPAGLVAYINKAIGVAQ